MHYLSRLFHQSLWSTEEESLHTLDGNRKIEHIVSGSCLATTLLDLESEVPPLRTGTSPKLAIPVTARNLFLRLMIPFRAA